MIKPLSADQFLRDVANHAMTVLRDDGLYRHLMFRQPVNGWNMWFEIITWPGRLAINGDMGTWIFARIDDMFGFFRGRPGKLEINRSYWAEKLLAESRFAGPHKGFDADTFKERVLSSLDGYDLAAEAKAAIIEALDALVFYIDDECTARRELDGFKYGDFQFSDPWEISGDDYSYHYLWCLYAIVWAIQQYDAFKQGEEKGGPK